jgi:hypothetical protein
MPPLLAKQPLPPHHSLVASSNDQESIVETAMRASIGEIAIIVVTAMKGNTVETAMKGNTVETVKESIGANIAMVVDTRLS